MTEWLQQRLTRVKKLSQRWLYLAQTLEKIWEEFFDPECTRLENLRSGYLMDDEDLAKKMRELGDVVVHELKNVNRPLSIAWRHLELTYKEQVDIFAITAKRVIGHTDIEMCPYFAPIDKEYGTEFVTYKDLGLDESQKSIPPDGYFLTSRVLFILSWDDFSNKGYTAEQFTKNIYPLINSVKPLHIVCRTVTTTSSQTETNEYLAFASATRTIAKVALGQKEEANFPTTVYWGMAAAGGRSETTIYMGQPEQPVCPVSMVFGMCGVTFTRTKITRCDPNE